MKLCKKVDAENMKAKVKPIGGEKNGENRTVPIARKVRVISTILLINITGFNQCGLQEASLSLWESVDQLGVEAERRYSVNRNMKTNVKYKVVFIVTLFN